MKRSTYLLNRFLILSVGLLSLLLVIQLLQLVNVRWDLTEEKRYTVSEPSKNVLRNLNEPLLIESYLAGELPSNFERFKKAVEETLNQLAYYANGQIQFRFIDPSQAKSNRSRNDYYRSLIDKGLQPTNLTYTQNGKKSEKLVFPGILISYGERELAVPLLKGNRAALPEEMINQSIEGLEYEIVAGIQQIVASRKKKIAFIMGHEEPDSSNLAGFTNAILSQYDLYKLDLSQRQAPISGYDVVVIGKPKTAFSTREKYYLDQYVMRGGRLLVFIDALKVNVREAEGEGTIALPYELNLEDLLFRYGVRINRDYLIDFNSGFFPGVLGNIGDQPRIELMPWPFFPVATNYGDHAITKGLDATVFKFASSIDTVKAVGVEKTPIILSSPYTKVLTPPVQVRFEDWIQGLDPNFFQGSAQVMGYLLEGTFTSLFKNRPLPAGDLAGDFRESSPSTKMIIVSDGDFIRNDFNIQSGEPLALGVDPYVRTTYANEEFLLRSLSYLTDEDGLTLARNKQVKIRPLDRVKISAERQRWIVINTVLPVLLILALGFIKYSVRRKKFAR